MHQMVYNPIYSYLKKKVIAINEITKILLKNSFYSFRDNNY